MTGLTRLKEAAASTQIATDSDLDAVSATVVDNENRIIAIEETLGSVESMNWLDISANYTCPDNVIINKIHPTVDALTVTFPAHGVGKKVMLLISDVTTTITTPSGKILTRGGGEVTSTAISNKGEYEYVSDGVNWIDQSVASQVESEAVEFLASNASPLRATYKKYILGANLDFYLPNPSSLKKGDTVSVEALRGFTPRVVTHNVSTVMSTTKGDATSLSLNVAHEEVSFYWDLTKWVTL